MTGTKKIYTKIALSLSVGLLMLWVFLGAGTTIAWFTDSSEIQKNSFYIGDLDLVFSHKVDDGTYKEIKEDTHVFDDEALYEPGYVQVVYLKVENQGDVPFEYKLAVDVDDVTVAESVLGNEIYLPNYLKYGVLFGDTEEQLTREAATMVSNRNFPEETMNYPLNVYTKKDVIVMKPGDERYIALIVRMPETVGNMANYRGTVIPKVEMGLNVKASQEGTLD